MYLVVLGAGRGTRLRPVTSDTPKPLVEIDDDVSILDATLSNAVGRVDEIVIVTGYQSEAFDRWGRSWDGNLALSMEYNPEYDTSGPVVSLAKALPYLERDDFMITNGDTFYDRPVFSVLDDGRQRGIALVVSRITDPGPDSMKVRIDGDGVQEVDKVFDGHRSDVVSAGALLVRGDEARAAFVDALERFVEEEPNAYWHELVTYLAGTGRQIDPHFVDSDAWHEVDTPADLRTVQTQSGN